MMQILILSGHGVGHHCLEVNISVKIFVELCAESEILCSHKRKISICHSKLLIGIVKCKLILNRYCQLSIARNSQLSNGILTRPKVVRGQCSSETVQYLECWGWLSYRRRHWSVIRHLLWIPIERHLTMHF